MLVQVVQLTYMHLHRIKGQLVILTKSQDFQKNHKAPFPDPCNVSGISHLQIIFSNSQHMKLYKMQPVTHNVYYQVKVCGILQSFENSWVDRWQGDHLQLSAEWVCIRVLITLIFILNDEG